LQVRLPNNSTLTHTFSSEDKMQVVVDFVKQTISPNFELMTTFPRKVYGPSDFDRSLKELRKTNLSVSHSIPPFLTASLPPPPSLPPLELAPSCAFILKIL